MSSSEKRGIPFRPIVKRVRPAPKVKPIEKPARQVKIIKVTRKFVIFSNKKGIVQKRDRKTGRFVSIKRGKRKRREITHKLKAFV